MTPLPAASEPQIQVTKTWYPPNVVFRGSSAAACRFHQGMGRVINGRLEYTVGNAIGTTLNLQAQYNLQMGGQTKGSGAAQLRLAPKSSGTLQFGTAPSGSLFGSVLTVTVTACVTA